MMRATYKSATLLILWIVLASMTTVPSYAGGRLGVSEVGGGNKGGSHPSQPTIAWSPTSVEQTLLPGKTTTVSVNFVASENMTEASLVVSSSLASFVTVEPCSVGRIKQNQSVSVRIVIRPRRASSLGTFIGSIGLQEAQTGEGKTKLLSDAIPLTINIWAGASEHSTGLSFQAPPLGGTLIKATTLQGDITIVDFQAKASLQGGFISAFLIGTYDKPQSQNLQDWFEENVDQDYLLIANRAFEETSLSNGSPALVLSGQIPPEYGDLRGPVMSEAYMVTPAGDKVVSIVQSQDTVLFDRGYTQEQISNLLLKILATVQF